MSKATFSRNPMSSSRPVGVIETYATIDESGINSNNHRSELLIEDIFWLRGFQVERVSLVTYFDHNEEYTWKVLAEFKGASRSKYDNGTVSSTCLIQEACLIYDKQRLESVFNSLHQEFLYDPRAMTYAVYELKDRENFEANCSSFIKKQNLPKSFRVSDVMEKEVEMVNTC